MTHSGWITMLKCLDRKTELVNQLEDKCDHCKMCTHRPNCIYGENNLLVAKARELIHQPIEYIPGFYDSESLQERDRTYNQE